MNCSRRDMLLPAKKRLSHTDWIALCAVVAQAELAGMLVIPLKRSGAFAICPNYAGQTVQDPSKN